MDIFQHKPSQLLLRMGLDNNASWISTDTEQSVQNAVITHIITWRISPVFFFDIRVSRFNASHQQEVGQDVEIVIDHCTSDFEVCS